MRKNEESLRWLARLLADPTKIVVCHNAKFELKMFQAEGIDVLGLFGKGARIDCTMMMSKVLNSTSREHNLRHCSIVFLKRSTEDKDEITEWLRERNKPTQVRERGGRVLNFSDVPDEIVQRRVLWDVESTLLLYHFFRKRVDQTCPDLYETERTLVYACAEMEATGVRVDVTRAKLLRKRALRDADTILRDLQALVGDIDVTRKKRKQEIVVTIDANEFSPASNTQLEAAFKKLGIELKYKTKPKKDKRTGAMKGGGNWAFDEYAMLRYVSRPLASIIRDSGEENWSARKFYKAVKDAVVEHKLSKWEVLPPLVLKYRELTKMVSTYYNHLIEDCVDVHTEPNGREVGTMHCSFNQAEAMTGRFSCSEPNLQNMPRLMGPRECFVPRRGRHNWHFDYSQVEMKMFVHFAKDKHMAEYIDKDIHLYVATRIYKKPADQVTKEQRKRAKGTGFGILYGSGAEKQAETLTQKGLPTSVGEAKQVVASYHREFPSVRKLTNQLKVELARKGYVTNPLGRRYYIATKFGYKALNYLCQGTSADLMKRAMARIWLYLRQHGFKAKLLMTIHDEIVLEIPPSEVDRVVPAVMRIMEDRKSFFVPITVDAEVVNRRWSEKHEPKDLGYKLAA